MTLKTILTKKDQVKFQGVQNVSSFVICQAILSGRSTSCKCQKCLVISIQRSYEWWSLEWQRVLVEEVYISLSQAIYHCGGWLAIAGSENDRHRGLGCLVREMQQQNFSHQSTNIILLQLPQSSDILRNSKRRFILLTAILRVFCQLYNDSIFNDWAYM